MTLRYALTRLLLCVIFLSHVPVRAQQAGSRNDVARTAHAPAPSTSPLRGGAVAVERLRDEELNHSQVVEILDYLCNSIGPRLTGSSNLKTANLWTRDKLAQWGLVNAHLEAWGPFGRGWALKEFSAQVVGPQAFPLLAYPKAWSPGLKRRLNAEVVFADVKSEEDLQKYKGKLKGAIVLNGPMRTLKPRFEPPASRFGEKDLRELANAPDPKMRARASGHMTPEQRAATMLGDRKHQFFAEEGAALIIDPGRGSDGGTLFVQSAVVPQPFTEDPFAEGAPRIFFPWDKDAPKMVPQIVLAGDHYNRLARMIRQGQKVKMSVDLSVQYEDGDLMAYNTIAEIPGTDLKDEVVMLGAHLDSWHAGTGATDNAAGVAVVMEAVRLLQSLRLQPRRTVRIALWSGEEQGLRGARAYVTKHFGAFGDGSPAALAAARRGLEPAPRLNVTPEHEKLSVYFNLDNGTGKIRGIYLQGNEAAGQLFRGWFAPFKDGGAETLTMSNASGTDHVPFDEIGLPGFQFLQDEIEYYTRTHHSNQDVFDRAQIEDLKYNAVVLATFVYQAATIDERLPRVPVRGQ